MTYNEMYPVSAGEIVTVSTAQYNAGTDTTISVADGTILQSAPNYVTIRPPDDDESGNWVTVKYTGKNAMSLTGVTIVYGSSTAALTYSYPLNSRVYSTLTKAVLDVIQGNITDHQTRVTAAESDIDNLESGKLSTQYSASEDNYIAKVDPTDHVLKVMAAGTTTVAWNDVTNKPTEFPPAAHTQGISTVTGLQTALDGKVNVDGDKVLSDNNYADADKAIVDGVSSALAGKVDVAQGVAKKDYFLRVNAAGNVEAVSYAPSGTQWGSITGTMSSQTDLQAELDAKQATISDIATIRSNASAGKTHADITTGNPHNVTKGDVGLGNVNNTADADKPISTATQTALDAKVDAVSGKGLSTNDYTTAEKTKLAGIAAGAEVNTIAGVQKNGTDLTPDANRKVNITVPTALSGLTDDTTHRVVTDTQISTWNGKANAADVTALGNRVTTAEGDIDALETAVAGKEPAITKNTAFNKNFGTSSGTVCEGNDARLSDARTPTSHASTHGKNGTDEVSIDATQVTSGTIDSARLPVATTSAVGGVKVDGTTITIDANGVISSQGGGGGGDTIYTIRITKGANADGVFVTCSNPAISVNTYQERLTIIQSMCRHCLATAGLGTIRYVQEDNFLVDVNGNAVTLDNSQGYGDFLLEVDNIWWTIDEDANNIYWKFTKKDMSGGTWQSAHKFNGTYREKIYYGVFNGVVSDGRLMSIASTAYPASTQNIDDFYTQAHNGGTTYHIENLPQRMLMIGLHLFLYATKNIQSIVCGLNKDYGSSVADCQAVNAGFSAIGGWTQGRTPSVPASSDDYNYNCMTMGIMNYFGKQWQFTGETIFNGGNWKFAMDANDHYQNMASGSYANAPAAWTVVQAGTATNLSHSYVGVVSGDARAPFIPVSSGGSSTTYYCDAAWSATGDRCCCSGANVANAAGVAGLFAFTVHNALSNSSWSIGARLLIHGGV